MRVLIFAMLVALVFASSPVKYSYCEGDGSQYEYQVDWTSTYTQPAEVVKNIHMFLYITGYFNDDVVMSDLELDVWWGGALL